MREAEHLPAIRRITSILEWMNDPASRLRAMLSADAAHPPVVPPALDLSRADPSLVQQRVAGGILERVRSRVILPRPDGGERAYADAILAEASRQRALEAAGWIVLRVRWADFDDPVALEQRIREAYYVGKSRRALVLTA
jgi:hypothetical protein